jgi:hypothetical protein
MGLAMNKGDKIEYEILEDGVLSVKTDAISATNHMSAEKLLETIFDMVGGDVQVQKWEHSHLHLEHGHSHAHDHGHTH